MKRLFPVLLCVALGTLGFYLTEVYRSNAGITCTIPFTFANGQTADATQVNSNFTQLSGCFQNNVAASGANNDITGLFALSTAIAPVNGGTPLYIGSNAGGSANAQVVSTTTPANFALSAGRQVTFQCLGTNTGAMTLNVVNTGVTNVFRQSQLGVTATVGGECIAGKNVTVMFNGTNFVFLGQDALVGQMKHWGTAVAPPGWQNLDGSCQSQTGATFADLFSVIGNTYNNSCAGGQFGIPDMRGRAFFVKDDLGGTAAGNIVFSGSACTGTTLGNKCGTVGLNSPTSSVGSSITAGSVTASVLNPALIVGGIIKL